MAWMSDWDGLLLGAMSQLIVLLMVFSLFFFCAVMVVFEELIRTSTTHSRRCTVDGVVDVQTCVQVFRRLHHMTLHVFRVLGSTHLTLSSVPALANTHRDSVLIHVLVFAGASTQCRVWGSRI